MWIVDLLLNCRILTYFFGDCIASDESYFRERESTRQTSLSEQSDVISFHSISFYLM